MSLKAVGEETVVCKTENLWVHEDVTIEQNKGQVLQLLCRICFTTDGNLYSMRMGNGLDKAYKTLTGLSIQNEENIPPYLCIECSSQLMKCINFRTRSLRAHLLLLEILREHGSITLEEIQRLNGCQDVNSSNLDATENSNLIDQDNLESLVNIKKETEYTEEQCLRNESRSQDIGHYITKKDDEYLFNPDTVKNEDMLCSSMGGLQGEIFLRDIKVENCAYNEGTHDVNGHEYSYAFRDDGLDYNVPGEQTGEIKFSKSKVKGITKTDQTTGNNLLLYDICPYKTVSDENLLRHLKTHDSTKSFKCNTSSTRQKPNYRNNPSTCDHCKNTYSSKCGLRRHMKSHLGDKVRLKCDFCPKSFKEKRDLQNHLRTHSGEKPFGCDICKKSFSERGNLLRHIRIHSGEKPYVCKFCKRTYNQKHHLTRHLTKHSHINL